MNITRGLAAAALAAVIAVAVSGSVRLPDLTWPVKPLPPPSPAAGPTIDDLTVPIIISHRGGPIRYPEHSLEAYAASADDGFVIEPDIRFLADGTPVALHDATTGRTMTGSNVPATWIGLDNWQGRQVKPAPGTSAYGTPATLEEILDAHAGSSVLIPEVKVDTAAAVQRVVDELDDRSLQGSAIVQVGSLTHAHIPVGAGFQTLVLTNAATQIPPAQIVAAGVEWVGVSAGTPDAYIAACKAAGLRVLVYTVNNYFTMTAKVKAGADGVFSDDPWALRVSAW